MRDGSGTFRRRAISAACGVLALGLGLQAGGAGAESLAVPALAGQDWRFSVTPYVFLPLDTSGTSGVAGVSADLDLGLSDVLDTLSFAAMLRAEAWRGDVGLILDGYYVQTEDGETFATGEDFGGRLDADVKTDQGWVNVMAAWRFLEGEHAPGLRHALDVSAGARWNRLTQDVTLTGGLGGSQDFGGTEIWWEPIMGLRGAWQIDARWTLGLRGDVSGFGTGGNDLSWLVLAGADWRFRDRTSLKIGYQANGTDFSNDRADGDFVYDVIQHGPYLGLTFRF